MSHENDALDLAVPLTWELIIPKENGRGGGRQVKREECAFLNEIGKDLLQNHTATLEAWSVRMARLSRGSLKSFSNERYSKDSQSSRKQKPCSYICRQWGNIAKYYPTQVASCSTLEISHVIRRKIMASLMAFAAVAQMAMLYLPFTETQGKIIWILFSCHDFLETMMQLKRYLFRTVLAHNSSLSFVTKISSYLPRRIFRLVALYIWMLWSFDTYNLNNIYRLYKPCVSLSDDCHLKDISESRRCWSEKKLVRVSTLNFHNDQV